VDGANPSFIHQTLKDRVHDDTNYEYQISYFRKAYPSVYDSEFPQSNMFVIPVNIGKYHRETLAHVKEMMEYNNGHMAIYSRHNKLITALRTAVENGEGVVDKAVISHDD
jgi:hypothetical protein